MLLSPIISGIAALAVGVEATTSSTSTSVSQTSTSSTAGATHSIAVGASGFVFEPHNITNASVGDIIEFRFYPTGHYVVRSEFKQPCIPYEDTGPNKVGFTSGAVDVATTSDNGPTFQVRVNDTEPIFFYCAAPDSCTQHLMVGVINPNDTFTYDIQLAYAENATFQMTPGEAFPSETGSSTSASSTSGVSSSSSGNRLGTGAIAGISIGGAAVAILAAALIYMCGRRGGMHSAFHHNRAQGVAVYPNDNNDNLNNAGGPPMQDAKYRYGGPGPGPKSPGQETFTTASSENYHPLQMQAGGHYAGGAAPQHHPSGVPYPPPSTGSPPPLSEYGSAQSLYNLHGQHYGMGGGGSPPIGVGDGGVNAMQNGFFITPQVPPHHHKRQQSSTAGFAVELATSSNPGNSPLPGYSSQAYSWVQGGEGTYRPSKP